MELAGKVALVTGAGSGIGRASALRLARAGAKVAALSRTERELRTLVDEIAGAGGEGLVLVADLSEPAGVREAVEQTVARWGRLDIVVANAGINGVWAALEALDPAEWDRTIRINLTGTFLTVKNAVPHLK